jgi:hypothetical protein
MDRKTRSFRPQTDGLESRLLLSLTATPPPEGAEVTTLSDRSGSAPAAAITNAVRGRYFAAEDNRAADAPLHVQLNGNGRVDGIGRARLTGSLDLGGFRIAGSQDVSGTLTLANARGTVKLQLTSSGGFEEVPGGRFVTSVSAVKGTGAYRGFQRSGTVTFDFGANQVQSIRAPSPIGGAVTVTLSLKPLTK